MVDATDRVEDLLLMADGGGRVTLETRLVRLAVGVVLMFPSLVGGVEGEGSSAIVVVVVVVVAVVVVRSARKYPGLSPIRTRV